MLIIRVCVDLVFYNLLYIQFDKIIYISIKICVRVCVCAYQLFGSEISTATLHHNTFHLAM